MEPQSGSFRWDDFQIGFWHPFGPHGGETPEQILARKADEISKNGWTLWSFRSRSADPTAELLRWDDAIQQEGQPKVFALCADSRVGSSKEPSSMTAAARDYKPAAGGTWLPVPDVVKIPHHFGDKMLACAFKVKSVYLLPVSQPQSVVTIEWLNSEGKWRSDILPNGLHYPNKGEYLLRPAKASPARLRPVKAILELEPPYVVAIRK